MSKRLRGFLLAFLGLAALTALGLALLALFGNWGGMLVAQEPPLPTATERQWTYPVGHTPQPTITPLPPAGAYPLPTQGPTITPWPTETPWPTPEPPPPPQPVGLQIVWAEAVWDEKTNFWGSFTFYIADVGDLAARRAFYVVPESERQGPIAKNSLAEATLSPNRDFIGYTTYTDRHIESNGTLWVMRLENGKPQELIQGISARQLLWSRDSRILAYVRHTPRVSPPVNKESSPDRPEIHAISVDGKEDKTLFAEDDVVLHLLGWAVDGQLLCLLSSDRPDIKPGLWSLDVASGERTFVTALWDQNVRLSPDGRRLLLRMPEGFVCLSADGRERKDVAFPGIVVTATDETNFKQIADISWAGNSSEVIFQTSPDTWRIGNLDTGAARDIIVAPPPPDLQYHLISISPDSQWLLVQEYASGGISLLPVNSRYRITVADRNTNFRFAGWLPRSSGGTQ